MIDVSFIIHVYNTGIYLQKCVDRVTNQQEDNTEFILVDDGSNDTSPKFMMTMQQGIHLSQHYKSSPQVLLQQRMRGVFLYYRRWIIKNSNGKD